MRLTPCPAATPPIACTGAGWAIGAEAGASDSTGEGFVLETPASASGWLAADGSGCCAASDP